MITIFKNRRFIKQFLMDFRSLITLFGFKSVSFTPPCYIWDKEIENFWPKMRLNLSKQAKHRISLILVENI